MHPIEINQPQLISKAETCAILEIKENGFDNCLRGANTSAKAKLIATLKDKKVKKLPEKRGRYFRSSIFFPYEEVMKVKEEVDKLSRTACAYCGKPFKPRHTQMTCSRTCRRKQKNIHMVQHRQKQKEGKPKKSSQASQNRPQSLAATKTPSKSSQKPQKPYSENKSNFFKSIQPTNEYGMPSDYQTGQQTVNTQHLCACGRSANPFTGKCSTCAIQSRYRQMQPVRMKGI